MIRITLLSLVSLALISCGGVSTPSGSNTPEPKPVEYIPPTGLD
ncbi:hypothetical protein V2O64_06245 [Verrucomicrobiaceae bacterium 227]